MQLEQIVEQAESAIAAADSPTALDEVRVEYMGKKGQLTELLKGLGKLDPSERREAGQKINEAKQQVQTSINARKELLKAAELAQKLEAERIDVTLPGRHSAVGGVHPVTQTIRRIEQFFGDLGFSVKEGPEVEDGFHNFDALNIPANHPARADHDTFYFTPQQCCVRKLLVYKFVLWKMKNRHYGSFLQEGFTGMITTRPTHRCFIRSKG